jgi:hypothetical protein
MIPESYLLMCCWLTCETCMIQEDPILKRGIAI